MPQSFHLSLGPRAQFSKLSLGNYYWHSRKRGFISLVNRQSQTLHTFFKSVTSYSEMPKGHAVFQKFRGHPRPTERSTLAKPT